MVTIGRGIVQSELTYCKDMSAYWGRSACFEHRYCAEHIYDREAVKFDKWIQFPTADKKFLSGRCSWWSVIHALMKCIVVSELALRSYN